jgi:PIN like domain
MSDIKTDIFTANKVYPDAKGLFYESFQSLAQIRDNCIVVIDTNALLVPYGISKNSLSQIANTYTVLAEAGRLIIPGQVAREFAKNRPVKIAEIFQVLSRKRNFTSPDKGRYPLLEDAPSYAKLIELEGEIDKLISQYRDTISDLLDHIRSWNWNDPVSTLYSQIFPNVVFDPILNEDDILKQLEYQHANKLPPGYKDAAKDDRGIGDQLIWQVVVQAAKENKKPVVFVSGDSKADWFYRSEGQPLFPRFELVDEVRRVSDGKSLHIVSFSTFLELFGATAEVIGEVHKEEIKVDLSNMSRYGRAVIVAHLAEEAVAHWLRSNYPEFDLSRDERSGDYIWSEAGGASILVTVKYFKGDVGGEVRTRLRHSQTQFDRMYEKGSSQFDNILIFLVFDSPTSIDSSIQYLAPFLDKEKALQARFVLAHLSKDGRLFVQDPFNALPSFS